MYPCHVLFHMSYFADSFSFFFLVPSLFFLSCFEGEVGAKPPESDPLPTGRCIAKTEREWRTLLTPERFEILRRKGTERPFTGSLLDNKAKGVYVCAACQHKLFSSETKFESGTGWPSFFKPLSGQSLRKISDYSYGVVREELVCACCGSHLGHVFPDGPKPTGLRYCINSLSLEFIEK